MENKIITKRIKEKLAEYDDRYDENKIAFLLALIVEVLAEISLNTENIANKVWE